MEERRREGGGVGVKLRVMGHRHPCVWRFEEIFETLGKIGNSVGVRWLTAHFLIGYCNLGIVMW